MKEEVLNMIKRIIIIACLYSAFNPLSISGADRPNPGNRDFNDSFGRFFKFEKSLVLSEEKNLIGRVRKLSIGPDGHFWILDSKLVKISRYKQTGEFVSSAGRKGQGPGEFMLPADFFIGKEAIYVVDPLARKLHVFSLNWDFKYFFYIEDGRMVREGQDGEIIIAAPLLLDNKNNSACIQVYDKRGKRRRSFFPINENTLRQDLISDNVMIDLDRQGNLFCMQEMEYKIYHYTAKGQLIKTFSKPSANYIPPPTKVFKNKFLRSEAEKWLKSWTHVLDIKTGHDLLFVTTRFIESSYEFGLDIYNKDGGLIQGNLETDYRLLDIDDRGNLYFLNEVIGPEGLDTSYHIMVYSINDKKMPANDRNK